MKCQNDPPHTIPKGVKYCAMCGKPPRRIWLRRKAWLIPIFVMVIVVVGIGGFESAYHDRVYPRVRIVVPGGTIDVGGMSAGAVETALEPISIKQRFRRIRLLAPGHAAILVPAYVLGYSIKGGVTAARALRVGREQSALESILKQLQTLRQGARVALAQRVNQSALRAYLFTLAPSVKRHAKLRAPGRRLDVVRTAYAITHMLVRGGPSTLQLQFIAIPRLAAARLAKSDRPK